jgi:2-iminobutanoate/2-iminopropanoate deaminase
VIRRVPGQAPALSGAVTYGGLVFTAGLVAPSALAGAMPGIAEQVGEVLAALDDVLSAAGSDLASVLRIEAFLADPADLPVWDAAFAATWPTEPPARTTVSLTLVVPTVLFELQAVAAAD